MRTNARVLVIIFTAAVGLATGARSGSALEGPGMLMPVDPDAPATFVPGPDPRPGVLHTPIYPDNVRPGIDAEERFCLLSTRTGQCVPAAAASPSGRGPTFLPISVGAWVSNNNPSRDEIVTFNWSVSPYQGTMCSDTFGNRWSNTPGASFPRGVWDQPDQFDWSVYCVGPGPGNEAAASVHFVVRQPPPVPPPPPPPPPPSPPPPPPPVDTTPPVMGDWGLSGSTTTTITIWWNAARDNVGVGGYNVYRNGTWVTSVGPLARSYVFSGLACGTSYALGLQAYDLAGNLTTPSTKTFSTAGCSSPPPPPPPRDPPLLPGSFSWGTESFDSTTARVRCKTQTWTQTWQTYGFLDVLRYDGSFRVCYRPGKNIAEVSWVAGDAVWTRLPFTWLGNDSGYPKAIASTYRVVFQYRGAVAICVVAPVCGTQKHPFVNITFYPDNTTEREVGVA